MVSNSVFSYQYDHYAYDFVNKTAIKKVMKEGIKPIRLDGITDISSIRGVSFFNDINVLKNFLHKMYEESNIDNIEILRYNIKNRQCRRLSEDLYYLVRKVPKDQIEYLQIFDEKNGIYLPLNIANLANEDIHKWDNLQNYKVKTYNKR